jgi:hypothetical protein
MTFTLRWTAPPRVSCFHAGDALHRGPPLCDETVREALAAAVERLDTALAEMGLDPSEFWDLAPPLAARMETSAALAKAFLHARRPAHESPSNFEMLTACIADLENASLRLWPRLAEELALREGPIREQWDARGPGMLRRMLELAGARFAIPPVEVALVQPCLGGAGEVHSPITWSVWKRS